MATRTRLHYILPILRQLSIGAARRLRPGGLRASLPDPSRDRPFIIVTGTGRSGTSAVARVLHESGVRMGSEFDPPSEFNAEGFYEEVGLRVMNEQILAELGIAGIWRSGRWPWRSTVLAAATHYGDQMDALAASALDGWKDPILNVTLEAWLPYLPSRPKLVVCLRSPDAYAESVARKFGLADRATMRRRWDREYRRLLAVIRDYQIEATCVEYDALVEHPEPVVAALAEFVGHPLQAEYVNPPLRRFRHPVPQQHLRLYQKVRALGGAVAQAAPNRDGTPNVIATDEVAAQERAGPVSVEAIDAYAQRVNNIEARVQAARPAWVMNVGLPRLKLVDFQKLGLSLSEAMEQTQAGCAEFASLVNEAQEELGALEPPPGFERYHELVEGSLNQERLLTELVRAAAQGDAPERRMLKSALHFWKRFGRGAALDKAQARRQREYARALQASGYLAARRAAEVK